MKKLIVLGFVVSILLIPVATAQFTIWDDDDIFWDNLDDFWYWLGILLKRGNWTMQNLNLSDITSCSEALETDAQGKIICGTDAVGGSGVGLWQVVSGWMFGNVSAGGTQKINITDIMSPNTAMVITPTETGDGYTEVRTYPLGDAANSYAGYTAYTNSSLVDYIYIQASENSDYATLGSSDGKTLKIHSGTGADLPMRLWADEFHFSAAGAPTFVEIIGDLNVSGHIYGIGGIGGGETIFMNVSGGEARFSSRLFNISQTGNLDMSGSAIISGNLTVAGDLTTTGDISADIYTGNGSQLIDVIHTEMDPLWTGNYSGYNKSAWDEAYGWGNHSDGGYLTSESDPLWSGNESNVCFLDNSQVITGVKNITQKMIFANGSIIGPVLEFWGGAGGEYKAGRIYAKGPGASRLALESSASFDFIMTGDAASYEIPFYQGALGNRSANIMFKIFGRGTTSGNAIVIEYNSIGGAEGVGKVSVGDGNLSLVADSGEISLFTLNRGKFLYIRQGTTTGPYSISTQSDVGINIDDTQFNVNEISASGVTGSGKVVCVKADGNFGVCNSGVDIGGSCTCI